MPWVYLACTCQNVACLMFKQKSALEKGVCEAESAPKHSLEICCSLIQKLSKVMNTAKRTWLENDFSLGCLHSRNLAQSWSTYVCILNLYIMWTMTFLQLYTNWSCGSGHVYRRTCNTKQLPPPPTAAFLKGTIILASLNGKFHGYHGRNYFRKSSRDLHGNLPYYTTE